MLLRATAVEGRLRLRIEPDPLVRVPARGTATATVHARRTGGTRPTYAIELRATDRDRPDDGDRALVHHLRFRDAPLPRPCGGGAHRPPRPSAAAVFGALLALVAVAFVYALTVPEPGEPASPASPASSASLPDIHQFQQHRDPAAAMVTLTWSVTAAATVTLNGRPVAPAGMQALALPDTAATYELRATNGQGTVANRLAGAEARVPSDPTNLSRPRGPRLSVAGVGGARGARAGLGRSRRPGATRAHPRRSPLLAAGRGAQRRADGRSKGAAGGTAARTPSRGRAGATTRRGGHAMRRRSARATPLWRPIAQLPLIASLIDAATDAARARRRYHGARDRHGHGAARRPVAGRLATGPGAGAMPVRRAAHSRTAPQGRALDRPAQAATRGDRHDPHAHG